MAGNYGGNSLATTPIAGDTLFAARATTYKDWLCTKNITGTFVYDGHTIPVGTDMVINPGRITSDPTSNTIFICYECSCSSPMTGTTAPSAVYSGMSAMNRPTIIGGGGLNN